MEDGFMNFQSVRIHQLKEKDLLENRNIWINDEINESTEFMFIKMVDKLLERDKNNKISPKEAQPINIRISSYGGCVRSTLSIVDRINTLKKMGYKVYGYAYAKAMSGAFKIFISCSKRFAQSSTDLMCHMPNNFEYGYKTLEDQKRDYKATDRLWQRCKNIILENTNIAEEDINKAVDRNDDMFFWADESIEQNLGIVDELF